MISITHTSTQFESVSISPLASAITERIGTVEISTVIVFEFVFSLCVLLPYERSMRNGVRRQKTNSVVVLLNL